MDVVQKQDRATLTEKKKTKRKETEKDDANSPEKDKAPDARKLKKKLLRVAEKNETLSKAILDKNQEIADLKRSVQSLNDVLNSVPIDELRCNSSIASSKILELSKKNRQLRAELETTKNKVSKKETQVSKLERELKSAQQKFKQDVDLMHKGNYSPIDELQSKVNTLQQKLFESRNKNLELHTQLKLAQKCLQQEVGENFNLNILASQPAQSNWRGRAQQILHLQQRLHELKERLDFYEHHGKDPTSGRMNSCLGPTLEREKLNVPNLGLKTLSAGAFKIKVPANGAASANDATASSIKLIRLGGNNNNTNTNTVATFDRFAPGVRKSEILHRAKVDTLEKEIETLRGQLEDHRGKILALKVRNKTLNDEVIKYKMKSCTLEEQTDYNGLNLATMNEKLNIQKYEYENRIEEICRKVSAAERQRDAAEFGQEELRNKLDNLESLLAKKEEHIMEQNDVIKKLEDDLKAISGDYLFSCRELRKEEFIAILDSLEAEKNQLLEHNKAMTERLEQERKKNEGLLEQISKQKVRISRSEAKIREMEKDLEIQTERKKRTQRITEYANTVNSMSNCNSVPSFVFETSSAVNNVPGDSRQNNPPEGHQYVIELKDQLEYANEKLTLLEEKLAHLSAEKESDARTFHDIINNSKSVILGTIMSQRTLIHTSLQEMEMI